MARTWLPIFFFFKGLGYLARGQLGLARGGWTWSAVARSVATRPNLASRELEMVTWDRTSVVEEGRG